MISYIYKVNDNKIYAYTQDKKDLVLDKTLSLAPGAYDLDIEENKIKSANVLKLSLDEFIDGIDFDSWEPIFNTPKELKQHMIKFAKKMLKYKLQNSFVLLRSHNDADGFCAAVGIAKIFPNSTKIIYPSPAYNIRDAIHDSSLLANKNQALLILTDLGGNKESQESIDLIKILDINYLIIDHHPFNNPDPEHFLISWEYDSSGKYTAAFLTNEIARILGYKEDEFINIGLIGDKSTLIEPTEELKEKAIVIDFLTSYISDYNFIYNVLNNHVLYKEYLNQAKEKYNIIKNMIKELRYIEINGLKIYIIEAEKIINRTEFQSTGKIASYILDEIDKNALVLVYNKDRCTIRVGEEAFARGVDTHKIMNELGNSIVGGGHLRAASFRFHEGQKKIVEAKIIELVRKIVK